MAERFYAEIFQHSGASYHQAMQRWPKARDEEFNAALALLELSDTDLVLDVPAGGAYLQRYLKLPNNYLAFDFSGGFASDTSIGKCKETRIPIANNAVDKTICLAAMHHVENKPEFVNELHRCLCHDGTLVIGDVIAGSKPANFLNEFVDAWNSLGHEGDFIQPDRDIALLEDAGFKTKFQTKCYHWNFADEAECHHYLRLLFALDKKPSNEVLNKAIEVLGKSESSHGYHLSWSLGFLIAKKESA